MMHEDSIKTLWFCSNARASHEPQAGNMTSLSAIQQEVTLYHWWEIVPPHPLPSNSQKPQLCVMSGLSMLTNCNLFLAHKPRLKHNSKIPIFRQETDCSMLKLFISDIATSFFQIRKSLILAVHTRQCEMRREI